MDLRQKYWDGSTQLRLQNRTIFGYRRRIVLHMITQVPTIKRWLRYAPHARCANRMDTGGQMPI
jgi:hypothetical protein